MTSGIRRTSEMFLSEIYDKYGSEYTVLSEYKKAHEKVLVRHEKCGCEWEIEANSLLRKARCPMCNGGVSFSESEFKRRLFKKYGDGYILIDRYTNARKKVTFLCNKCRYCFNMTPDNILRGHGCPRCFRSRISERYSKSDKDFKNEVKNLVGNEYIFLDKYSTGRKKMRCKHVRCGNVYMVTPNNFLSGKRCPFCKSSRGEAEVRMYLLEKGVFFEEQVRFDDCRYKKSLPFDFYLPTMNTLIEFDGEQHFQPIEHWGGERSFLEIQQRDKIKTDFCLSNNIKLIRISYMDDVKEVLENQIE